MAKIVVSHKGVKRRLETPFAVCASSEDLDALIGALRRARASMLESPHSWVLVDDRHPSDAGSGEPIDWDDAP